MRLFTPAFARGGGLASILPDHPQFCADMAEALIRCSSESAVSPEAPVIKSGRRRLEQSMPFRWSFLMVLTAPVSSPLGALTAASWQRACTSGPHQCTRMSGSDAGRLVCGITDTHAVPPWPWDPGWLFRVLQTAHPCRRPEVELCSKPLPAGLSSQLCWVDSGSSCSAMAGAAVGFIVLYSCRMQASCFRYTA